MRRLTVITDVTGDSVPQLIADWVAESERPVLSVLDVTAAVRRPSAGRDLYQEDYEFAQQVRSVARSNRVTILGNTHTNQGEHTDFTHRVQGSMGYIAPADAVLVLGRRRGENIGSLSVTGKTVPEKTDMGFRLIAGRAWQVYDGFIPDPNLGDLSRRIMALIAEHPQGVTIEDVAKELGEDYDKVKRYLGRLKEAERISKPVRCVYAPIQTTEGTPGRVSPPSPLSLPDEEDERWGQ